MSELSNCPLCTMRLQDGRCVRHGRVERVFDKTVFENEDDTNAVDIYGPEGDFWCCLDRADLTALIAFIDKGLQP